jgi:hypothetical protein
MFEALWPKQRDKIILIESNMQKHSQLFNEEVTIENIQREHEARVETLQRFKRQEDFEASQKFRALETAVGPRTYDERLDWLRNRTCQGTAKWLMDDQIFLRWRDVSVQTTRLLWLQGIPGAGKGIYLLNQYSLNARLIPSHNREDVSCWLYC